MYGGKYIEAMTRDAKNFYAEESEDWNTNKVATPACEHLARFVELPFDAVDPGRIFWQFELAEAVERPDAMTVIWHIRKGIKKHDLAPSTGEEFTSEDVKATMQRYLTDGYRMMQRFTYIDPSGVNHDDVWSYPDRYTAVLQVSKPWRDALYHFMESRSNIFVWENIDNVESKPIGTGPFMFKDYRKGVGYEYVRNPGYWRKHLPYVDAVSFPIIPDFQALVAKFLAGDIDYLMLPTRAKEAVEPGNKNIKWWGPWEMPIMERLNLNTRDSVFNDIRVRQALRDLFDYNMFGDSIHGEGNWARPGGLWAPKQVFAIDPQTGKRYKMPEQNIERGKALLAEAGYGPDNPLKVTLVQPALPGTMEPVPDVIVAILKPFNIDVKVKNIDYIQWVDEVKARGMNYDMTCYQDCMEAELDTGIYHKYHTKGGYNNTHYSNPDVDRWAEQISGEMDDEKVWEPMRKVTLKVLEEAPTLPLSTGLWFAGAQPWLHMVAANSWSHLGGWSIQWQFSTNWFDETAPKRA